MVAGLRVAGLLLREIILHEAEALERPALVDLGSGGGVLSGDILDSCRRSIASTAPRAASRPVRDSAIEPVLADASDSTLPKGTADHVICAIVLEVAQAKFCAPIDPLAGPRRRDVDAA